MEMHYKLYGLHETKRSLAKSDYDGENILYHKIVTLSFIYSLKAFLQV